MGCALLGGFAVELCAVSSVQKLDEVEGWRIVGYCRKLSMRQLQKTSNQHHLRALPV
jgi:hypothetical protein